jgi:hypothetical protein
MDIGETVYDGRGSPAADAGGRSRSDDRRSLFRRRAACGVFAPDPLAMAVTILNIE